MPFGYFNKLMWSTQSKTAVILGSRVFKSLGLLKPNKYVVPNQFNKQYYRLLEVPQIWRI